MRNRISKALIAALIIIGPLGFYGCDEQAPEPVKHVDLQEDAENVIYTAKDQLGGYTVLKMPMFEIETGETYRAKKFYLVIGYTQDTKLGRKLIEVTKKLWLNCDEGEAFPRIVEKDFSQ